MCCIYKIESPTGSVYIGQTWNYNSREYSYSKKKCKNQTKLYNSINKYTWESHKMSIVVELPNDITQNILDTYEDVYLTAYKDLGINILNIRNAGSRGSHTEDTKIKMRDTKRKQYIENPEIFSNFKSSLFGRVMSTESKEKIRQKKLGANNHNYQKYGELHYLYGKESPKKSKKLDSETIKKSRDAMKHLMKPVDLYDLNENKLQSFDSINSAAKILNISADIIRKNLKKSTNSVYKKWKFKYSYQ